MGIFCVTFTTGMGDHVGLIVIVVGAGREREFVAIVGDEDSTTGVRERGEADTATVGRGGATPDPVEVRGGHDVLER